MKQVVKVLAVSDVHGDMDKVELGDAEVVIVAGDICRDQKTGKYKNWHRKDISVDWAFDSKTIAYFSSHPNVRYYILPGNHDKFAKDKTVLAKVKKTWPANVKIIDGAGYVDESGLTIWGMPWNPIHMRNGKPSGAAYGADSEKIIRKCKKISRHFKCLDILVTHAPPKLPTGAYDENNWHLSPELAAMLPELDPKLLICGHRHQISHKPVKYGKTTIVNVAMKLQHTLIEDGGRFDFEPRRITMTVERDVAMDIENPNGDMKVRPVCGVTNEDANWLKQKSLELARIVRGVDKLIDEDRSAETEGRDTGKNFAKLLEHDLARLLDLAKSDLTGRVKKLLSVIDMLQQSRAAGWCVPVLANKWYPKAPCMQYDPNRNGVRRNGNLDFSEYEYQISMKCK